MADKLILRDEDEKKKKPGLVMQDDPVRLPAPKPITETPSIGQTVPNTGLQLQDDPSRTISFKSKPVEEQRSNIVDMTEGSLQKFYEKGEYPSIPQDQLDKYLDAKYGDVWSEDFLGKAKRGVGSAFEMIGEDLFVNLFYEGPKQSARMGLTNIADQFMERDAASATLKREFLSLSEPATRLSIRQQRTGGGSKLVDDLKQIQVEERRAIHNATKFFFLDPRAGYKESDGERRPTFLKNTKAREDKFKKVIESIKAESVRRAKLILPAEKAEGLKVKSVSEMFDRKIEPGFGVWKAFDPNLKSILWDTAKIAHPFSSVPTAAESLTRGSADIGMIGHFIANNMFDMTAHHQRTVNKHLNMRLKEYWGKRGSEYKPAGAGFYPDAPKPNMKGISGEQVEQWLGEVGKAHDELKKIRRDEWAMMQVLITDREKARLGLDPMVSQYIKNWDKELPGNQEAWAKWFKKTINSKYAEAGSYGLDPVTIATGGIGAFSKAPLVATGRGVVRTLGSGGVKLTGELLEGGGKKLGAAVSKVDSVAGEGAAGAAAGAAVGLTTDLPLVPSIVGGATASGVVQPIQKGSALAKWVEASGLTLQAAGEILAREPGMEGFMRRLSMSSTAPERVATAASKLEWADNAITFGADITKASGTGAVIGGGLGVATGEGTEFTFAGAATGGTLGAATVIPVRMVTPASKVKQLADVDAWVQRQPEGVRKFLKAKPIEDQITASELDLFVKGFGAYEGKGDVVVEYIHSKEGIEGAWVDTEGKIIINLGYEGPRTLSHEIGHAARSLAMAEPEGSPMREKYEQLRSKLFERTAGGTTLKGWYSIEDEIEFAKQYHERLKKSVSEEKLRDWEVKNGFDFKTSELTKEGYLANDKGRMTIQGEIEAESFANFIQGNKPGATFKARTAKQRMLNHIMLSEHSRTLGAMRWMLEDVFKVKFNGDGSVSKMFQKNGKGITNSKVVNAAIGEFIAARKAVREQIVPDSGSMSPGQKFNMEEVRSEPSLVEYFGAHDAFAKDRNGNILFVDDKPVMLPDREIGKLQRNRMKQMVAALESVDEIGGLKMEKTSKGKKRWSGKNFSEDQVNALLALPDDVFSPRLKDNLKFIYDKINEGASIHYDYNSALSLGKYSSEISAAWRHDMPYAVEITQAGNFLVKGINVDRINSKISKWKSDKKGRFLDLWEGNHSEFYADLMQYMSNHRKGDKGKTGLHPDGAMAKRRADRINELFGVYGSELKRSETVGRLSKRGAESSRRFDRINQLRTGGGEWSADYGYLKDAYMPAAPEKGGAKFMPAAGGAKVARVTGKDTAVLDKDFSAQFMPSPVAPNAVLKDFHKKKVQILTTDLTVAADKAVDGVVIKFAGGPGHLGWHDGWGYTNEGSAKAFGTRWEREGRPLIGITSMTPNNHLNQPLSREYYTAKWREVIENGLISERKVNKHVREVIDRLVKSEASGAGALPDKIKAQLAKVKTFKQFSKIFHDEKVIPWTHASKIYKKLAQKTLPISFDERVSLGTDLDSIAHATRQPEYHEAPTGSLLAIAEYDGTAPTFRPDLNKAYPWFVPLKEKAFLKQFHDVRKLSTDKDLLTPKGKVNPGTMMGKGIILDRLAKGDVRYMPAGKGGDIFYSNSSKALESPKVRKSAPGPAMLNDILKVDRAAGVEMKEIGLDRWLRDKKGKVTKEEVQDFIDANQIGVFEKTRREDTGAAPEEITHYENKIRDLEDELAGAENRDDAFAAQERVDIEGELEAARSELESLNKEGGPLHDKPELVLPGAKKGSYRELELMLPKRKGEQFTQSHFKGDENVFAHVRSNERTDADGKRMLFIEEAQSDWAAKGRDLGFDEPYINGDIVGGPTESVPAAPFVSKRKGDKFVEDDRWRMLAVKRMIRMAADEGYDRLGWINGRDTADRNDMGNYVSELEWQRLPGEDRVMISAKNKEGDLVIKGKDFQVKDLADVVGKELAGKILKSNELGGEYSGLDLHTGGVFWKRFYDEKLPSYVRRYTSKWKGAKVGEVGIGDTTAHYVDITPQMKADVQQGQAMFMPAGKMDLGVSKKEFVSNEYARYGISPKLNEHLGNVVGTRKSKDAGTLNELILNPELRGELSDVLDTPVRVTDDWDSLKELGLIPETLKDGRVSAAVAYFRNFTDPKTGERLKSGEIVLTSELAHNSGKNLSRTLIEEALHAKRNFLMRAFDNEAPYRKRTHEVTAKKGASHFSKPLTKKQLGDLYDSISLKKPSTDKQLRLERDLKKLKRN